MSGSYEIKGIIIRIPHTGGHFSNAGIVCSGVSPCCYGYTFIACIKIIGCLHGGFSLSRTAESRLPGSSVDGPFRLYTAACGKDSQRLPALICQDLDLMDISSSVHIADNAGAASSFAGIGIRACTIA